MMYIKYLMRYLAHSKSSMKGSVSNLTESITGTKEAVQSGGEMT